MAGEGQSQAKERTRAVGRGDGPAGRGCCRGRPLTLSLQQSGKALVLLCTILQFTFLNSFFP